MLSWLTKTYLGKLVATFLISMIPVVELRGGIPYGVGMGLPLWQAYLVAVLGNMLPVPFIILFLRRIFDWLRKFDKTSGLVEKLETRAHLKGEKVQKYEAFGLFLLVAVPLPGTGAWTGSLVASVFGMRLKRAFPIILAGVMTAGILMLVLSHLGFNVL